MTTISAKEKVKTFEKELELIFDKNIRSFTELCLITAPDYIFIDCPASSSGRYHSLNELGPNGTILHTKKVFTVAYDLCRGLGCEDDRDIILSGTIIHDLVKQGWKKSGHTDKKHPGYAADLVKRVQEASGLLTERDYNNLYQAVGLHYGLWSVGSWVKPLKDYTPIDLTVYISDYIASKRFIDVDTRR